MYVRMKEVDLENKDYLRIFVGQLSARKITFPFLKYTN